MKWFVLTTLLLFTVGCDETLDSEDGNTTVETADPQAMNLFLVTIDGLRWQEVFRGLDESLAANSDYSERSEYISDLYWDADPQRRAELLMPFLHGTVFLDGTVVGNRDVDSCARVTNPWYFSYPGYNEILTGVVDEGIDSNAKIPNPNETFLEKLNADKDYAGKVAAFASWDVFPYILNVERSGLPVNVAQSAEPAANEFERFLNRLQGDIPSPWANVRLDAFTHHYALSYIENNHPRVVYLGYGETDDFAHDAKYDEYVIAANRTDRFIQELWQTIQSDEFYKDRTILFITVDHGRGEEPEEAWRHHASGEDGIVGSDSVWMAAIGPGVPANGMVATGDDCLTSNRIAATLLQLLGEDYKLFNPQMGQPLEDFLQQ